MSKNTIPLVSTLAATMTGCADPIIGDWTVTKYLDWDIPHTETVTEEYNGTTYEYTVNLNAMDMTIDAELAGTFKTDQRMSSDGTEYDLSFESTVAVVVTDAGYDITLTPEGDDMDELVLNCTLESALSCTNNDMQGLEATNKTIEFAKK